MLKIQAQRGSRDYSQCKKNKNSWFFCCFVSATRFWIQSLVYLLFSDWIPTTARVQSTLLLIKIKFSFSSLELCGVVVRDSRLSEDVCNKKSQYNEFDCNSNWVLAISRSETLIIYHLRILRRIMFYVLVWALNTLSSWLDTIKTTVSYWTGNKHNWIRWIFELIQLKHIFRLLKF